jgi:hypothetical protein
MAALRAMRNNPTKVSLEAVAMEVAKVAMRELHDGVVACQASVEARMYGDDAADEESRVAAMAVVAAGMTVWLLIDGGETEVEDSDDEAEAAAEAHRDAQLHVAEVRVKAVAEAERVTAMKAERVTATEAERVAEAEAEEHEAVERAVHWAAEMDRALAYRRDVDRRDVARQEAARRAETEHCIERRMTVRR